jgi:hypothetical protein
MARITATTAAGVTRRPVPARRTTLLRLAKPASPFKAVPSADRPFWNRDQTLLDGNVGMIPGEV